ncbi:hypothetical protein ACFE04_026653 [Oxalis oulophora]
MKKLQLLQSLSGGGGGCGSLKEWTAEVAAGKEEEEQMQSPPSIKLRLGIGGSDGDSDDVAAGFTPSQLNELQQQSLIFKHMAARLPVPLHLVVPIWNSVVRSLATDSIYKLYPSCESPVSVVGWSPECFDYKNMVDPEPGRCRRTDGKKWRCGKNVIPNQKYCERHMHRGRQRSRKLVEASKIARPLIAVQLNSKPYEKPKPILTSVSPPLITHSNSISHREKPRVAISSQPDPVFAARILSYTPSVPISTIYKNTTSIVPSFFKPGKVSVTPPASSNVGATSTTTVVPNKNNTTSKINSKVDAKHIHQIGKSECDIKICFSRSPGLDLSPKRVVLQGNTAELHAKGCKSCVNVTIDCEPGRCRRTDGKKWRCSRDVVPTQKYCPKHMHRGAKRHTSDSNQKHISLALTPTLYKAPNSSLSISIPTSPQLNADKEKRSTSSESDATISDTNISKCENSLSRKL